MLIISRILIINLRFGNWRTSSSGKLLQNLTPFPESDLFVCQIRCTLNKIIASLGCYLNNGVLLSRNYQLIVDPQKFVREAKLRG